ncbi:YkvA family protein [Bacillus pumilus]|uniref:YkvA family protein n=2 Tax=Bacillaceae TaxID=186817 RepID=UPI000DD0A2E3|nr:YkvA family protein [Bacillus pumilus]
MNRSEKKELLKRSKKHFNDHAFWEKLKKTAQKAGVSLVYAVLLLYYTLQKPEVPVKAKTLIIGALGYFILPIDLIPDTLIGVGYTDDLGAITFALIQVAVYIDDDVKGKAQDRLSKWFGEKTDTSLIDQKLEDGGMPSAH